MPAEEGTGVVYTFFWPIKCLAVKCILYLDVGAETPVYLALLPPDTKFPNGKFLFEKKVLPFVKGNGRKIFQIFIVYCLYASKENKFDLCRHTSLAACIISFKSCFINNY